MLYLKQNEYYVDFFIREVIEMFSQWRYIEESQASTIKSCPTAKTFINHSLKLNLLRGRT